MQEPSTGWDTVFTSHDMHEVASYYQVRVLQKKQLKLIHNLWYKMPYPIAGDIFASYTFKDRLECIPHGMIRTLEEYYHRPQWELYDLNSDTKELTSLIEEPAHQDVVKELRQELLASLRTTNDPWICSLEGVLVGQACHSVDDGP